MNYDARITYDDLNSYVKGGHSVRASQNQFGQLDLASVKDQIGGNERELARATNQYIS
jgi:hypothetical protein